MSAALVSRSLGRAARSLACTLSPFNLTFTLSLGFAHLAGSSITGCASGILSSLIRVGICPLVTSPHVHPVDRDCLSRGSCVIAFLGSVNGEISPPPSRSLSGTVSATEGDRSGSHTRHVRTLAVDEMMNSIRRWYPWHYATTN